MSDYSIKSLKAREVLDSRGNPTVEVDLIIGDRYFRAMVPSGASTGVHEALELRDKDERYGGKGVRKAVENANNLIAPKIVGLDVREQKELDDLMCELDGTPTKSKLGANAILPVSMAAAKAAASLQEIPLYVHLANLSQRKGVTLPVPQLNVVNGGKHAGLENDIQEHMLMPVGAPNFSEALRMGAEAYHALKKILKKKFGALSTQLGDEGGFVPPLKTSEERLETMTQAVEEAGYSNEIYLALDCASSEFYHEGNYKLGDKAYSSGELVDHYKDLTEKFNIISIEDGMSEDDWSGWQEMTKKIGEKIQIIGDDLLVTNVERLKKAIELEAANSLLLKVNQIGTVSESIDAAKLSFDNGFSVVTSHRSGETEDPFIADLVVGLDAGQSKFGAPARSDRNAKYNQLLRIEEQLGERAVYAGKKFRKPI
ncbi:phosphopyruvate hydratase [Candidatus Altiarchaeota archaeon]